MLVRWCLDAVSTSRVFQFPVILGTDVVSFGPENVSFGTLVASALATWGTIERSQGTSEHKKGDLGVLTWIFIDLGSISGSNFESSVGTFDL